MFVITRLCDVPSLCSSADLFVSSLLGTPKEPFSHGMAHNELWHKKNGLWGFRPGDTKLAIRP